MRHRSDVIDTLLEDWASWRYLYKSLDFGTGDCVIVRFSEPRSTCPVGSTPLWLGRRTGRKLLALDNDLCQRLGSIPVAVLVTLYGTTGPIDKKARALETTVCRLHQLRRAARKITLSHIATDTSAEDFHRARYRIRSKKPEHPARPLRPVPEVHKGGA